MPEIHFHTHDVCDMYEAPSDVYKLRALLQDLVQYKDRDKWYLPKFAADDAPDWNPAQLVEVKQQAPGLREVILKAEVSREHIPIRNAYKHVGQRAQVRVKSGASAELTGMYFAASASASVCLRNATPRSHRVWKIPLMHSLSTHPCACIRYTDVSIKSTVVVCILLLAERACLVCRARWRRPSSSTSTLVVLFQQQGRVLPNNQCLKHCHRQVVSGNL